MIKTVKGLWLLNVFRFLFLILSILPYLTLPGQEQDLSSRYFTVKDGLPQGFISGIVQDKVGYIWISTRNGLTRYDGRKFKVFYHDPKDSTSIAGNIILNIFLDSRNRLWINYESAGLDVFYPDTENVFHISQQNGFAPLKDMEMENDAIYEGKDSEMFFNTLKKGLIQLNVDKPGPLQFPLKNIIPAEETVRGFTQNKRHHLFVLTNKNLYQLSEKQELISKTSFTISQPVAMNVQNRYKMFFPSDTVLFLSGSNAIVKYQVKDHNYTVASISPVIKTLWRASNYYLLYPDSKEGVLHFTDSPSSYTFSTNATDNTISLLDKTNVLWIGTSGHGIQLVYLRHNSFQYQKYTPPYTAFLIKKYFPVNSANIPPSLASTNLSHIYNLRWAYDKTGKLWICNKNPYDELVMPVYAYDNKKFSRPDWHYIKGEKIKNEVTLGISTDSRNNLWILTTKFQIHKLNPVSGLVQTYSPSFPDNIKGSEQSLLIDKQDNFWITSDSGLLQYREGWAGYKLYSLLTENEATVESNRFINIAEDLHDENKIWIGSLGNGLVSFSKKEKKFTSFTKKDGLPDNTIYSVMADDSGYLWCSTNRGIFRFDPATNKARKYASEDGAPDLEFNRFHHIRLPDGKFAFGGFEEYTVFDPLSFADDTSRPDVAITDWKINNQPAEYREKGSPIHQSINSLKEVHLTYHQNFLYFEFAALQYNQPEILEYRYKLSDIDNDWVYARNNNSVNYTALSPGTYTFFINAANAAGVWSNKIKELRIVIDPPWWKTMWAYLLYAVIVCSVIYLLVRNRLKQLRLQNQMLLKQKEAIQMKQLDELKNRFFSNITHELRTPLSLIISPVEKQLLENGETYSPKVLKGVQQNARHLLRLINQLLDMSKLEAGSMQLSLSRGELVVFVEQLITVFKPNAEAKQIQLSLHATDVSGEYVFDNDKLEKIINNLLSNAFKFTPQGGSISVELSIKEKTYLNHFIQIAVKDTGIGISAKNLPNIFDRFYQADNSTTRKYEGTGIGLSLVNELVKLIGGTIVAESEEGKGSSFTITLPLQSALQTTVIPLITQPATEPAQLPAISEHNTPTGDVAVTAFSPLILVTDDNNQLREFIIECLQPFYRIITAANGAEGLQQAQNEIPDIIISDVMMPVMDGYEFCAQVKQNTATNHIAFIMLTAKAALESRMSGLKLGADDYLTKPFHVEELLLRISNLLKRQEKLRQFYRNQLQPGAPAPVINEVQDAFLQAVYTAIEKHLDNEALDVGNACR